MKNKNLGIEIKIEKIDNGFTLSLFARYDPDRCDKTMFAKNLDHALGIIRNWNRRLAYDSKIEKVQVEIEE